MQKILNLGAIAALAALPLAATAGAPPAEEGLSYNYLEAGWIFGDEIDIENTGPSGDQSISGWTFGASAEVAPNVFVYGNNNSVDFDIGNTTDIGLDTQSLGVGYHFPLLTGSNPLDIYAAVSYERADAVASSDGYGATLGLRWMPIQGFEVNAWGSWRDYGKFGGTNTPGIGDMDGWVYGAGALYHVTQNLALMANWQHYGLTLDTAGGKSDVDIDGFVAGARWYY